MKTLLEVHEQARAAAALADVHGGDVRVSGEFIRNVVDVLAEALRTTGGDPPRASADLSWRINRLERSFFDDGEWVSEPWRRAVANVSEGAQRDAADLHRRVSVIEKRLVPPNPDGSWALLTTTEATTAIERLETEVAEMRKGAGERAHDHQLLWQTVHKAERQADAAVAKVGTVLQRVAALDRGVKQLTAEWQNIRNRLKALLSSAS